MGVAEKCGKQEPALFFEATQLLSIYYRVEMHTASEFPFSDNILETSITDQQKLRWASIFQLKPEAMTLPIDRVVAKRLKELL
jgi:hypothetical protein